MTQTETLDYLQIKLGIKIQSCLSDEEEPEILSVLITTPYAQDLLDRQGLQEVIDGLQELCNRMYE